MSTRTSPQPVLSAALIRRRARPLLLAPPSAYAPSRTIAAAEPAASGWSDDLRFFLTCYAAGVAFFLIMLS